jgi:hypothetical protein
MTIVLPALWAAATAGGIFDNDPMSPTPTPPVVVGQSPKSLIIVQGV